MPKVVIIVLVVIAMLFVVTLGLGAGNHGGSADPDHPPALVDALDGLGGSRFLEVSGDVSSNCAANTPRRLTVNGSCSIIVPSRSAFSRPLRVVARPASGTFNAALLPNAGRRPDPALGIPRSDAPCFESAVDHQGATIALSCAGAGQCQVDLIERKC